MDIAVNAVDLTCRETLLAAAPEAVYPYVGYRDVWKRIGCGMYCEGTICVGDDRDATLLENLVE